MTPIEAGKIINKNPEFIRAGLRQGRFDFGTAIQSKTGKWNYVIIKSKFLEFVGQQQDTRDIDLKYILTNNKVIVKELRKYGITTERQLDEEISKMKKLNIGCFVNKISSEKEVN